MDSQGNFIVSGDLTESGTAAQFETRAETLHRTGIDPDLHKTSTRGRIFGTTAIVDDTDHASRVRLYDLRSGLLESIGLA